MKRREYVFHYLQPAGAPPLQGHEGQVLHGIFANGATEVRLSDLENEFYRCLPAVKEGIFRRLMERGLYRSRPDRVKNGWVAVAVILGSVIAIFGSGWGASRGLQPFPFFLAGLVSGLIIVLFARVMPARTVAGARALERLLGFEEFLGRVDKDRFERVVKTPELFEKYLPYAMALGVDRRWAQAFRDIYREPPSWYVGSNLGAFNLDTFSGRLADLSSRTSSVMTSSPRSSGGSGFSGGGSSGGGTGGGGGGGW